MGRTSSKINCSFLLALALILNMASVEAETDSTLSIYDQIGVDEQRKKQIADLLTSFNKQEATRQIALGEYKHKFSLLVLQPLPDKSQLSVLQSNLEQLYAQRGGEEIDLIVSIRKILTPAEREKLIEQQKAADNLVTLSNEFEHQDNLRKKQLADLYANLKSMLSSSKPPDEQAILAKQDEINRTTAEIATETIKHALKTMVSQK